MLIVIHPSLPVKSVKDLIALAKARPGSALVRAPLRAARRTWRESSSSSMRASTCLFVPYKGEGPAIATPSADRSRWSFRTCRLRCRSRRAAGLLRARGDEPETRCLPRGDSDRSRIGIAGYEAGNPGSRLCSRPPRRRARSSSSSAPSRRRAHQRGGGQGAHGGTGLFVVANTPEQFADFLKTEIPRWAKVVKDAGVKPQ
jgi:hypothetical protein